MSKLDTNHVVNLDLVKDRVNSVIKFGLADVETSDFYLGLYNNGSRVFDKDYIVTLYIVKPNGTFRNIELEPKEGLKKYYCNLPDTLKNIPGEYVCQAIIFDNLTSEKKISKSKFKYSVDLDLASEMAGIIDEEEQESILTNILNRLLTLENPVEPYATQKHVDECVSTLTEEIDATKVKDVEQDGRLNTVETKNNEQDNRLDIIEAKDIAHESRMANIESKNTEQDNRLSNIETKNVEQDSRLDVAENRLDNIGNDITNTMQPIIDGHTSRLEAIEAIDVAQNNRLDAIEVKNQQQDDRLLDIEKVNKRQDMNLKCLFAESKNNMIDVTEEGNSIYLQNSTIGYTLIDEIKGNTLVNCNKEPDKELILNGNINTSGDNIITLTKGVDGGLVDVALEGNTLVNVSKTKDSTAISKAYTVENSGNHIALQGEYDGSCRPVIEGNTLVNLLDLDFIDKEATSSNPSYVSSANKELGWDWSIGQMQNNWIQIKNKLNIVQPNKTYTLIVNIKQNNPMLDGELISIDFDGQLWVPNCNAIFINIPKGKTGICKWVFTPTENTSRQGNMIGWCTSSKDLNNNILINGGKLIIEDIMILEGDYTDKVIPNYFEGLQSSFEDNLVTQEMVDSGEEVADNLGKYRVDYKSTREDGTVGSTKTLYLNSPLLEGDTIEEKDGGIYHVHRYTKLDGSNVSKINYYPNNSTGETAIFTIKVNNRKIGGLYLCDKFVNFDGNIWNVVARNDKECIDVTRDVTGAVLSISKNKLSSITPDGLCLYLQSNPITVVYELETPNYELIGQSNLAIPSYTNGHLDFNTAIPVEKVDFLPFSEGLTYLYANTQYTVQFVSDVATTADITLGGTSLLAQSIVAGLNRITITTPAALVDNKLVISGVGANISEVVVTDTNREFMYFEGMKSVGEGGNLVITSSNSDNSQSNTQQLTHEPLRAVGDAKDRYVLIDGKWYIKKECGIRAYQEGDKDNYKTDLVNTVYPLEMPTYEEIDYNPLEVYSGTTHVTTNSAIPASIIVKNHGFNCLLKPSTTYTISSNLGLNTVTTPSTLTEDCLRFMDTDTSDVTTMKDVLVLEGDWTTKADLIPANFSGIESAFEQELVTDENDEHYGKYKVTAKVVGKNLFDGKLEYGTRNGDTGNLVWSNGIVRNVNDIVVKPNTSYCMTVTNTIGSFWIYEYDRDYNYLLRTPLDFRHVNKAKFTTLSNTKYIGFNSGVLNTYGTNEIIQLELGTEATGYEPYKESVIKFYIKDPLRGVGDVKDKVFIQDDKVIVQRNCGVRAYEDGDFGTYITDKVNTVYPLAEPTYEEVEYNDTKLFIESFKNSTLFYNSNVPVTSKLYYSYSVPIVDTVSQTANVTDQQDSMIIDMAVQVSVLEMMTL